MSSSSDSATAADRAGGPSASASAAAAARAASATSGRLGAPFRPRAQRRWLAVGAAAVVAMAVAVATTPPATGFETSVTGAYPWWFTAAFAVAVASVVVVALGAAVARTGYWRHALALLLAADGLLLALPLARGYALYGRGTSDPLAHLALAQRTVATGDPPGVFYPAFHVLVAELVHLGVPLAATQPLLAYALTVLYVVGVTVLARALLGDPRGYPLGLAAATPLLLSEFHAQIHPAVLSVALLPVLAAALEWSRRTDAARHVVVAAAVAFGLVVIHPVTTVLAAALVASTALGTRLYPAVTGAGIRRLRLSIALALAPAALVWFLEFGQTRVMLVRVLAAASAPPIADEIGQATAAALTAEQLAVRFAQLYGPAFVYFLLAGAACLLVVGYARRASYPELHLVGQYVLGGLFAVGFLATYLIASNPIRVSRYLILASTAVVAVVLGGRLLADEPPGLVTSRPAGAAAPTRARARARDDRPGSGPARPAGAAVRTRADGGVDGPVDRPVSPDRRPRTARGRAALALVLAVAIVAAAVGGAGTVYEPNKHLTHAEVQGADFAIVHHDGATPVRSLALTDKTQRYVVGARAAEHRSPVLHDPYPTDGDATALPPGLGYPDDPSVTAVETLGRSYVVTMAYDVEWHTADYFTPAQRAARVHYVAADVARMDRDPTVDRVYTNGGFDLWAVG